MAGKGTSRSYNDKDLKLLLGRSAGRCSFPNCRRECIIEKTDKDPEAIVGKIAHIVAHGDKGPRSDPAMPAEERRKYANLIWLCPSCHDLVDAQPNTFTSNDLRRWKSEHEAWVGDSLLREMVAVNFRELHIVTDALVVGPAPVTTDFRVTDPAEKMRRNGLTSQVNQYLTLGYSRASEVQDFVQHMSTRIPDFPERIKAGFLEEYRRLRAAGESGDILFESLLKFAASGSREFRRQAAGLAVLTYLFETCEVFEP